MGEEITTMDVLLRIDKKLDLMNGRVRSLEVWRGRLQGAVTLLSLIVIPIALRVFF